MPVIKSEIAEGIEPEELTNYVIENVEYTQTEVQKWSGYRVEMSNVKESDENQYATMLWDRSKASVRSKLGCFMKAFLDYFGDEETAFDTDNWIGAEIRVLSWKDKNRQIRVIEKP